MGNNNLSAVAVIAALCLSSTPFAAASATESVTSDEATRTSQEAASSMEEAIRIANELLAQSENPLQYAMRTAREAAAEAEAAEKALRKELARRAAAGEDVSGLDSKTPQNSDMRYANSLRTLGQFQDPERLDVLAHALSSNSTPVRVAALEALRDGTVHDNSVLSLVRDMVTSDPDPLVRRGALEVYARYGNQAEVLSLVKSLGRVNGPTRDIAVREWLRIEREIADAPQADQQLKAR